MSIKVGKSQDLGANAAKIALENSGLSCNDIDLVICATGTPDVCAPTVAANIKKELGIESAPAFDMNTNCSRFVYAITVAESLMKNCNYKNAIGICVDINSQILDWEDRATAKKEYRYLFICINFLLNRINRT